MNIAKLGQLVAEKQAQNGRMPYQQMDYNMEKIIGSRPFGTQPKERTWGQWWNNQNAYGQSNNAQPQYPQPPTPGPQQTAQRPPQQPAAAKAPQQYWGSSSDRSGFFGQLGDYGGLWNANPTSLLGMPLAAALESRHYLTGNAPSIQQINDRSDPNSYASQYGINSNTGFFQGLRNVGGALSSPIAGMRNAFAEMGKGQAARNKAYQRRWKGKPPTFFPKSWGLF